MKLRKNCETENNFTLIAGDVGARKNLPYLTYFNKDGLNLISSGIGNLINDYVLNIRVSNIDDNLKFYKLSLNDFNEKEIKPQNEIYFTINNILKYILFSKTKIFSLLIFLSISMILIFWKIKINKLV